MNPTAPASPILTPATLFVGRVALAWALVVLALGGFTIIVSHGAIPRLATVLGVFLAMTVAIAIGAGVTHVRRAQMIAGRVDASTLSNRQRRQVEIPFPGEEAFSIIEQAIRELPRVHSVDVNRSALTLRAEVRKVDHYDTSGMGWDGLSVNLITASIADPARGSAGEPAARASECCGSAILQCEPNVGAWSDWLYLDDGSNLENAETLTRIIARLVAERRRAEQATAKQNAAEKELADARLALLQAQVEPHFLYNTLANAQLLTRSDPARADRMLGELITYLRCSLPKAEAGHTSLADELERAKAYLELMRIRMGERLAVEIEVDEATKGAPLPPMILQTLVENAIKHGLEPKTGPGKIWIRAQKVAEGVEVRVADDGRGFSNDTRGSGIGLKNARERLRLAFGEAASLSIAPNYPSGVTATLRLPHSN